MKRILAYTAAAAVCCKLFDVKAHAWVGVTHKDIMKKSLELLRIEKKTKEYNFFTEHYDELESGCTAPDRGVDIDHGAGMHYYSCCKPRGKQLPQTNGYYKDRLKRFLPSARTLMEQNYTSAVSLYKKGMVKEAMYCFARSAHFVSDMGCTVHVSNIRCFDRRGNIHNAFENHAKINCQGHTAKSFDRRLNKNYEKENFQDALNKLVNFSAKYVKQVRTLDPLAFDDIESNTLIYTQQSVAALMLRFYDDCMNERNNYLDEKRNYPFRNAATGLCLTVTNKGLTVEENNTDLDQRLKVQWNDKGYFNLKTTDSMLISKNLKSLIKDDDTDNAAFFRAICIAKNKYIITVGRKDFKKVLMCSKSGKLTIGKFVPASPLMVWSIS